MASTPAAATLTIPQLEALWLNAGGSKATAPVAASIAMAESSGRTAVTSSNPDGGTNVGPWQLDTKGVGAGYTISELQDPATNAKLAVKGSANGTNWSDWATYASGAYAAYLTEAQSSVSSVASDVKHFLEGLVISPAAGVANAATGGGLVGQLLSLPSQVTDFLTALEQPVKAAMWLVNPANWARIIAGIFGFLLLGAGLITLGLSA